MTKSIIQNEKKCIVCGRTTTLECHHCFPGNPNRKLSEKYGLKVWLCKEHHTGNTGVHSNAQLRWVIQRKAQREFERQIGDRNMFMTVFGKNYLED